MLVAMSGEVDERTDEHTMANRAHSSSSSSSDVRSINYPSVCPSSAIQLCAAYKSHRRSNPTTVCEPVYFIYTHSDVTEDVALIERFLFVRQSTIAPIRWARQLEVTAHR